MTPPSFSLPLSSLHNQSALSALFALARASGGGRSHARLVHHQTTPRGGSHPALFLSRAVNRRSFAWKARGAGYISAPRGVGEALDFFFFRYFLEESSSRTLVRWVRVRSARLGGSEREGRWCEWVLKNVRGSGGRL